MPQEPKKRHSRQRQGKRRAHIKLLPPALGLCKNCQKPVLPHTMCQNCGYYNGRKVLNIKDKSSKPTNEKERRPQT